MLEFGEYELKPPKTEVQKIKEAKEYYAQKKGIEHAFVFGVYLS